MFLSASACSVALRTAEERTKWKVLARQDYRVARQPCRALLHNLGLLQCFDELCNVGELNGIFTREIVSYHRLTLEFLTTLVVQMRGRNIVAIRFRLRNNEYELSMQELKEIYGITTDEYDMPMEFKNSRFWNDITLETEGFKAARAKSSMIRNPVLRMIQKACNNHPFARTETGSVQKDELFLLWCLVHKRPMNMAHYIVKNLERASRRSTWTICCGVVVGAIARHLEVDMRGFEHDIGSTVMDIEILRRSHDLGVDGGQAFFLQRLKDHFPLPDPINTYINGAVEKRNWKMNSPIHQAIAARYPNKRFEEVDPDEYEELDHAEFPEAPEVPEHLMIGHANEDEEEVHEEPDAEIPPYGDGGAGTSAQRTRSRQEREEEDYSSINERMARMELRQEEQWARNDARLTEYEARWNQFETQNDARWNRYEENWSQFTEFNTAQWANLNARFYEFRGPWQHPPPPPQ